MDKARSIKQKRTFSPTLFFVWEEARCGRHQNEGRRIDNRKEGGSEHLKRHQREIPRLRIQRQSSYHLLTAVGDDQTARLVESRRPRPGMRSGDSSRLIIFMLEVTDKPHKYDDLRIRHAQKVCDGGASFRPGYMIFVGSVTTSGKPKIRTAFGP